VLLVFLFSMYSAKDSRTRSLITFVLGVYFLFPTVKFDFEYFSSADTLLFVLSNLMGISVRYLVNEMRRYRHIMI